MENKKENKKSTGGWKTVVFNLPLGSLLKFMNEKNIPSSALTKFKEETIRVYADLEEQPWKDTYYDLTFLRGRLLYKSEGDENSQETQIGFYHIPKSKKDCTQMSLRDQGRLEELLHDNGIEGKVRLKKPEYYFSHQYTKEETQEVENGFRKENCEKIGCWECDNHSCNVRRRLHESEYRPAKTEQDIEDERRAEKYYEGLDAHDLLGE